MGDACASSTAGLAARSGLGDRGGGDSGCWFSMVRHKGPKSFYNTAASYKISLNRTLATTDFGLEVWQDSYDAALEACSVSVGYRPPHYL